MDNGFFGTMMNVKVTKSNGIVVSMRIECYGMRALIKAIDDEVGVGNWRSASYDCGNGFKSFDI